MGITKEFSTHVALTAACQTPLGGNTVELRYVGMEVREVFDFLFAVGDSSVYPSWIDRTNAVAKEIKRQHPWINEYPLSIPEDAEKVKRIVLAIDFVTAIKAKHGPTITLEQPGPNDPMFRPSVQ